MTADQVWLCIGLLGQTLFGCRMLVQWIVSEREGRSIVPTVFWWISIGGSMVLLSYAVHQRDPVFILGQSAGSFVYLRNLWLIYRERGATRPL